MGYDDYECKFCGHSMRWDETDETHGDMWGCERCDTTFCSACFVKRHGQKAFDKMLRESDKVLCPDCYKSERGEG